MRITVNEVIIKGSKYGHPYWFELSSGSQTVMFSHRDAYAIGQALCTVAKQIRSYARDNEKDEFGI